MMDGAHYDPGRPAPARCTRNADRRAVRHAVIMTLIMAVLVIGSVLLAGTFVPWVLDPAESWLAYAATVQ